MGMETSGYLLRSSICSAKFLFDPYASFAFHPVNSLISNVNKYVLPTKFLYIFIMGLVERICLSINACYLWLSFPIFS